MPSTGNFWTIAGAKASGLMDPDDIIIIPFDFSVYLTSQETTYDDHIIAPVPGFLLETVSVVAGVIKVRVYRNIAVTLSPQPSSIPVSVQVESADGQKYTKTLTLKLKEG